MHPVIIMAYDKSPAINKAVEALEEAGMEVRVLNTGHAKLAEFLGALAGEDEEEDPPKSDDEAMEREPDTGQNEPKEEEEDDEPLAKEALIDGEQVQLLIVEGSGLVLHPTEVHVGDKTSYKLNESKFSFWPKDVEDIKETVELQFPELEEEPHMNAISISTVTASPPVLEVGREFFREAAYPKKPSWAMLPAARAVFDKNRVSPTEVVKQWPGEITIMRRANKNTGKDHGLIMVPGKTGFELNDNPDNQFGSVKGMSSHHDQTFGYLGHMEVLGHLVQDGDTFKFDGPKKVEGLDSPEAIAKFKAPVYVFK